MYYVRQWNKKSRHDNYFNEAFYYGKKGKKIYAQDDNTLPTLKVSQQEPTSVSKKKKKVNNL